LRITDEAITKIHGDQCITVQFSEMREDITPHPFAAKWEYPIFKRIEGLIVAVRGLELQREALKPFFELWGPWIQQSVTGIREARQVQRRKTRRSNMRLLSYSSWFLSLLVHPSDTISPELSQFETREISVMINI